MHRLRSPLLAATVSVLALTGARADYLDDRSTPERLVESLYNALANKEFARAWSYFETKPSADFETYVAGFDETATVEVRTAPAETDAAAGTTRWHVPVAIRATATDGSEMVFAGCYVVRLANPQVQGEPYRPMAFEGARLALSDAPFEEALPAGCGAGETLSEDDRRLRTVRDRYRAEWAGDCDMEASSDGPKAWPIDFNYMSDLAEAPRRRAWLYGFTCRYAAYNVVDVFYLWEESEGLHHLAFAEPELDIRYVDDDTARLDSMEIIGFQTATQLINAQYDPDTYTITSYSKWRGLGDSWSAGKWIFRSGSFSLVRFEVDPTMDEKDEGVIVFDKDSAP
ncbi:DUF1176 domain-containing protein [Zhengella sp. ZM62]|uniref:DUF1176 domain-containing protein n=1 Tax=Zhengella sedimenti TaxID=3390035 RepID=UPI0039750C1A